MRESIARFRFLAGRSSREERLAQQRQILAERKALREREPKVRRYEWEVGGSAAVLAGLLLETGRADEALAVVEDVLPRSKSGADDKRDGSMPPQIDSRNYFLRRVLAELLARKGEALARLGKTADASRAIRQAIEIVEDLCKQEPCYLDDLAHHLTLASTLPDKRASTMPRTGRSRPFATTSPRASTTPTSSVTTRGSSHSASATISRSWSRNWT